MLQQQDRQGHELPIINGLDGFFVPLVGSETKAGLRNKIKEFILCGHILSVQQNYFRVNVL
jgi:hypothetical protein